MKLVYVWLTKSVYVWLTPWLSPRQGFNKELEEIYRIQKGYAIPDPELRQQLIRENKDFLLPRYQMFYSKYSTLNFTKNRSKYVKYDVAAVEKMLDSFFDAAA